MNAGFRLDRIGVVMMSAIGNVLPVLSVLKRVEIWRGRSGRPSGSREEGR